MTVQQPFRLRLIHFNDLHGRLAHVTPDAVQPVFSRIAAFVKRAREEAIDLPRAGVLVLSGGDDLIGSPFSELAGTRPEDFVCHPAYRLYSALGVDVCGIGNHDLDCGLGMLSLAAAQDASFPLVSANLKPAAWAASEAVLPSVILSVAGLRVGIIGLTTPGEINPLVPGEFEIVDPLAAVLDLLPTLRGRCDVLVVLSHLGYTAEAGSAVVKGVGDLELAAALPTGAVTVIVGSHTHTVLNEHGLEPASVVNGVAIVQAGSAGRFVGDVLIEVTAEGARVCEVRLWPVEELPEDPEFEKANVLPLAQPVLRLLAEPVGIVTPHEDLDRVRVKERLSAEESALANFIADALAARCRAAGLPVDFAMVDVSSVGDGLPQTGTLTYGDLFRLSPYADSIVLMRLPANQLQAFLNDNARRADLPGEPHEERGFVHFSHEVRYRVEAPRELGPAHLNGVEALRLRAHVRAMGAEWKGRTVAEATEGVETVVVAYSSFLRQFAVRWERRALEHGLALFDIQKLPHEVIRLAVREELIAYVRQMGGVTEAAGLIRDGRVRW